MPAPGLIRALRPASGPGIRDDGGVNAGYEVPVHYDSMIAKLVAWGGSRGDAIARMSRALDEYQVLGIRTTIPFFVWLMRQAEYRDGQYDTTWLDRLMAARRGESFNELDSDDVRLVTIAAAIDASLRAREGATAAAQADGPAQSLWQRVGRIEALRS
jgi:acetyl-CoA carboxylase biotin carboxylase subunit